MEINHCIGGPIPKICAADVAITLANLLVTVHVKSNRVSGIRRSQIHKRPLRCGVVGGNGGAGDQEQESGQHGISMLRGAWKSK